MEDKKENKWTSRKLGIAIGAIFTTLATAFAGVIEWGSAVSTVADIAMYYIGGQGIVDLGGKMAPVIAAWKTNGGAKDDKK